MLQLRAAVSALAILTGAAALLLAVLGQFGRISVRLDVLNHFSPLWLAAGLVAAALAVAGRPGLSRRIALATAGLAVVMAIVQLAPECYAALTQRRAAAGSNETFKVVQFNAWGRNARPTEAVRWILAQDADAVVVQEGSRIANGLMKGGYHASCLSCGVTVFTRAPQENVWPTSRFHPDNPYLTAATIRDPYGEIIVVGVHRHWPTRLARNRQSTAQLYAFLAKQPKARLVLAGDFNSTPWSFARRREDRDFGLVRRTLALPTWPAAQVSHNRLPAPFPYLPIDHVYAGPGWATVEVVRGPRLGSDHYPVVVTLAARPPGNMTKISRNARSPRAPS